MRELCGDYAASNSKFRGMFSRMNWDRFVGLTAVLDFRDLLGDSLMHTVINMLCYFATTPEARNR